MLKKVSLYHEKNKMTVSNLAIVWAPNLLWSTSISPSDAKNTINFNQHAESLTSLFIAESDYLFNLPDVDSYPTSSPLSPKQSHSAAITPRNSNYNLASSTYSQSVMVLPTFTQTPESKHRYSIPLMTDTVSMTEPIANQVDPCWNDHTSNSLSSTIPLPISTGSTSATVSEPVKANSVDSYECKKGGHTQTRITIKNIESFDRGRSSSSLSSAGTMTDIAEEEKREDINSSNEQISKTPRPFIRRCSSRRKSYNIKTQGSVKLPPLPTSPSIEINYPFNSPLFKTVYSPPLFARRDDKVVQTCPNKRTGLTKSASLSSIRKEKSSTPFKRNVKDKKRLPTSPINK